MSSKKSSSARRNSVRKATVPAEPRAKTVQQPSIGDRLALFEIWLVRNWKLLAGIAALVIVVLIGYGIFSHIGASREKAAAEALARAEAATMDEMRALAAASSEAGQIPEEAMQKAQADLEARIAGVVREHAGAKAVNVARIRLAEYALAGDRFDEAVAWYDEAAKHAPEPALAVIPRTAAAVALEKKGDWEAAAQRYAAIGADKNYSARSRCEANYQAGRIYFENDRFDEAVNYLESASGTTDSIYSDMAQTMLYRINAARHGDVAEVEAAAAETTE